MANSRLEVNIHTKKSGTGAKDAGKELDKLNKTVGGLKGAMGLLAGGTALGAVAAGLKFCVGQAMDAERAMALTKSTIKATGGAAGLTADQVGDMAGELSVMTGIADDVVQDGQNMLLTFKEIKGEANFERATKAMTDMAVAMNQGSLEGLDLKATSIQLGKALNDPIKGITALSKVGVTFSQEQKETIKTMVEMGDVAGAQAVILAELESEFGGAAEAAGETAAGEFAKLKNAASELGEEIGGHLLPTFADLASATTDGIQLSERLREARQKGLITLREEHRLVTQMHAGLLTEAQVTAQLSRELEIYAHNQASVNREVQIAAQLMPQAVEDTRSQAEATEHFSTNVNTAGRYLNQFIEVGQNATKVNKEGAEADKLRAEALEDLRLAAADSAIAFGNLAQSLKDATAADLAAVAIRNLDTALQAGTITEDEHKRATEQLMLQYGLATPASIAMADATGRLNQLLEAGIIDSDQLTAAIGLLPAAAEDGQVSMEELGISLNTHTTPALKDAKEEAIQAGDAINALQSKEITIKTNYINTYSEGAFGTQTGSGQGRAAGGPVQGGTPYMVGEQGPELFIPGMSGGIVNHGQTNEIIGLLRQIAGAGGGGNTYNIQAGGASVNQLADMLERRMGAKPDERRRTGARR